MKIDFKYISILFLGLCFGIFIPLVFVYTDLMELEMTFNIENIIDIFLSQKIYFLCTVLIPCLSLFVTWLLMRIKFQKDALSKQKLYYYSLIDLLPSMVMVFDEKFNFKKENEEASVFNRQQREEIKELVEMYTSHFNPSMGTSLSREVKINENHYIFNLRVLLNDKIKEYVITLQSIQDLKNQENIIQEQKEKMIFSSRLASLGEMAGGFAHEINNPLAVISGNVQMMRNTLKKEGQLSPRFEVLIDKNLKMVNRISKIIDGLRKLSRQTNEDKRDDVFKLNDLLTDVLEVSSIKLNQHNILVKKEGNFDITVKANFVQLTQVLINMINNASDAIEDLEEKWIEFLIIENEKQFTIRITDSGPGISEAIRQKIFEPMFTTKGVGKGTGLGLSISLSIIENHHGAITYVEGLNHTCFDITIPKHFQIQEAA